MQKTVILLLSFTFLICFKGFSQTDPAVVKVDSAMRRPGTKTSDSVLKKNVKLKPEKQKPAVVKDSARIALEKLPATAVKRSLLIPGWGQLSVNHRWWKVPFIYAGYVSLGLSFNFNQQYYHEFLAELRDRQARQLNGEAVDPTTKYAKYGTTELTSVKDFYRRNRDLTILGFVLMHTVQAIDAYVDAKFFRFDVGNDLALKVYPSVQNQPFASTYTMIPAIKLSLSVNCKSTKSLSQKK